MVFFLVSIPFLNLRVQGGNHVGIFVSIWFLYANFLFLLLLSVFFAKLVKGTGDWGGDKGVGGSRPWFEALGGPLSEAKH